MARVQRNKEGERERKTAMVAEHTISKLPRGSSFAPQDGALLNEGTEASIRRDLFSRHQIQPELPAVDPNELWRNRVPRVRGGVFTGN